jgi:tetratricopeptide (TPR) repeat protein
MARRLDLIRDDLKAILKHRASDRERAEEMHDEVIESIANVQTPSAATHVFAGVPSSSTHKIFGRDELLSEMTERLISGDSIALSAQGLPGVGKTTLAMALANSDEILEHFSDGILWAGLGKDADVTRRLSIWADALGIDVTGTPTEEDRSQAVKNAVGQRRMLLVIDDAWDVDSANLMRCGGPNCVHLLTTRNQKIARTFAGAQGTQDVPVLDDPDAFDMLKSLAPEARDASPEAAQELAKSVGGLPLALELLGRYLAAPERSYFPDLSVEAFAEMADPNRRLELAQSRLGAITSDEMALSKTINLSLEDLPEGAISGFHALGAFASKPESFDLDAAITVSEIDSQTLALLISRSLLEKDGQRLTLHQTLADFARQKLPSEAPTRHWDHYLALVNEDREDWRRIEPEYPQLKWAWDQAKKSQRLLDIVYALRIYQERRGLWRDDLDWASVGLNIAEGTGKRRDTAILLNDIGRMHNTLGQREKALEFYNQALPIMYEVGDRTGIATTLSNIGTMHDNLGRREKALAFYNQALPIEEEVGGRGGTATTLNNIGMVHNELGQREKALEFYNQALPILEEVGDRGGMATTLNNIGIVHDNLGRREKALAFYNQALYIMDEVGDRSGMATALNNIGGVYNALGQLEKALEFLNQVLPIMDEVGDRSGMAGSLNNIAGIYYGLGQLEKALGFFNQALPIMEEVGDIYGEGATRYNMAFIYLETGNLKEAEAHLLRVVDVWEAAQAPELEMARESLNEAQRRLAEGSQ